MKIAALVLLILLIAGGFAVYADGAKQPVDHSVSVTGVVQAPQEKVFTLITDVARGSQWRPAVKSVTVLQKNQDRDHWVEHLDHGQFMTFLATRTDPPNRRDVLLDDRRASYGGTWTYELSPGPEPNTTTLKITETGFIRPPLYRFIMAHVIGLNHNLDIYMKDIQAAAKK
jgi:uncharacterized protein YndB with AHSA1/START domain